MSQSQNIKELLAGSFGGVVQVLVGQPFDTVKVRLQTQSSTMYSGMFDCASKTMRIEGIRGIGACVSIQFAALESLKRHFNKDPSKLTLSQLFLCGAGSGMANSILSGPIEHVRIRLQVQATGEKLYSGPLDFLSKVYKQHGLFSGVYKAQGITMVREFLGYGIYFATYEYLIQKKIKENNIKRNQISAWHQLLYGALSGYALWLVIYPIDAVKSKLQTDGFSSSTRLYSGSLDCVKKTIAQQGISGLYKGFWTCMLRAGPANASTFAAYEIAMNFLGRE